jgi:dsRNA-specific ribonuclease
MRNELITTNSLSATAAYLNLDGLIRWNENPSMPEQTIKALPSLRSETLKAYIGALYLDQNIYLVKQILKYFMLGVGLLSV